MISKDRVSILVSVRNANEALDAFIAGADIVDAKEPRNGALGIMPLNSLKEVIYLLRDKKKFRGKLTATLGDYFFNARKKELNLEYFLLGVDAIKIGFNASGSINAKETFKYFCNVFEGFVKVHQKENPIIKVCKIVPVLLVDDGLETEYIDFIMKSPIANNFLGIMLDTKSKKQISIFDILSINYLRIAFKKFESLKIPYGISGSLSFADSNTIKELRPHWAGFRGGVCTNGRNGKLSKSKILLLKNALQFSQ